MSRVDRSAANAGPARPNANAAMAQIRIMAFSPPRFSGIIARSRCHGSRLAPLPRWRPLMPRHKAYVPHGVIPAVILPFHDDLSIDEASFRKHLRDVTSAEGLSAVTINAHSTE